MPTPTDNIGKEKKDKEEKTNATPEYPTKTIDGYKRYFSYLSKHRKYVRRACFSMGLYRQGLVHDLSKYLPSECKWYMRWFSMGDKCVLVRDNFELAWNYHQKRNKHHWQYRVLIEDGGAIRALDMPEKYIKEMLCDWRGVGRAFAEGDEEKEKRYKYCKWSEVYRRYNKNKDNITLSDETRTCVENFLEQEKSQDRILLVQDGIEHVYRDYYQTEPTQKAKGGTRARRF